MKRHPLSSWSSSSSSFPLVAPCKVMSLCLLSSDQAVKAVSHEATKLSLAFSKPPLPSPQVRFLVGL